MKLALVLLCLAGVAFADEDTPEKAQARVLLAQGNALFERGDLKGALVDFRAAYALYPSPKLLVNCAAAERELGDLAGAANDLRHYLDEAGTATTPSWPTAPAAISSCWSGKLGRVGAVRLAAHATLEVDGKPGRDPTYVKPGERHRVRAAPAHRRDPGSRGRSRAERRWWTLPIPRGVGPWCVPRRRADAPPSPVEGVGGGGGGDVGDRRRRRHGPGRGAGRASRRPSRSRATLGTFKFSDFH